MKEEKKWLFLTWNVLTITRRKRGEDLHRRLVREVSAGILDREILL